MFKEAIQYIVDLSGPRTIKVNGVDYGNKGLYIVHNDHIQTINTHTLTGLRDFQLFRNIEKPVIHIADETCAYLINSGFHCSNGQYQIDCAANVLENRIREGHYVSLEQTMIMLQTQFVQDEQSAKLLQALGCIVQDESITTEDDGISQNVMMKKGLSRISKAIISPRIILRPFRTFLEIEQPVSEFLIRLQKSKEYGVSVALFQADGMMWKLTAIKAIKAWFETNMPGVPVIA